MSKKSQHIILPINLLIKALHQSSLYRSLFIFIAWLAIWQIGRLVEYTDHASVWFPVAGFSFSCLLVLGKKAFLPIMMAAIVITIWNGDHYQLTLTHSELIWAGFLFGLAHIGPYWLGAHYIGRISQSDKHNTPKLIVRFLLIAGVSTLIATFLVISSLVVTDQMAITEVKKTLLPFWVGDLAGVIVLTPLFSGVLIYIFPKSNINLSEFTQDGLGSLKVLVTKMSLNVSLIVITMILAYLLNSRESSFAIFFLAVTHMWIACTESPIFNTISLALSSFLIVLLVHFLGLMDHVMVYQFAINVIAANALFGIAIPQLMSDNQALKQKVFTDELTNVSSRHHLVQQADLELSNSQKTNTPLSLVVFDIDRFKQVNDLYGHSAGDHALQSICEITKKALRSNEMIARFGGDEFVLLLPGLQAEAAYRVVERIRKSINTIKIGDTLMSSSFGIAQLNSSEDFNVLFKRADKALYISKGSGGNQINVAQ